MADIPDAVAFADAVTQLTSAFGDATRRAIYVHVQQAGDDGATAAEVARAFDLHPNVARHHLDKLVDGGYLDSATSKPARAGRPSKRYVTSAKSVSLSYPVKRDDLLVTLLANALEALEPAQATELAEKVGYDYGLSVAAEMRQGTGPASFHDAMRTVAAALDAHGFDTTVRPAGRWHATITAAHCPFGAAAHAHPHLICALDRGMVKGMLASLYGDTCPETLASLPLGAAVCVTRV